LEAENKRLRSALGIIAHFPTDSPIKNLVDAAYYIGWLVANAREVLGEGGHMEDTNEREDMIEDEINACPGCGDRYFPRRSDCEACIAVVDERIAARGALPIQDSEAPRPRRTVLVIGGHRMGFGAAVARRLAAAGNGVVVLPEGTRIDPPEGLRSFEDWRDFEVPEQLPEAPRDRTDRISGLQLGRKHNKKKGKR